jgi:hypothetical protein
MDEFRDDLKAANILFINPAGLRADFHSLRHTLATNLARAGTAPRVAMEIMRHSDMRLTAKTYTDAGLLPVADAVLKLPGLTAPKVAGTQIGTQKLFPAGQTESAPVKPLPIAPLTQLTEDEYTRLKNGEPVTPGHKWEGMGRTGFEPVIRQAPSVTCYSRGKYKLCGINLTPRHSRLDSRVWRQFSSDQTRSSG